MTAAAHLQLKKAPVILVLAQIRFTPFLKMSAHIVDIQDEMRKKGFPLFNEEQALIAGPGGPVNTSRPRYLWIFSNTKRTQSVILTESFVVLETNEYDIFASFLNKFQGVIELLKNNVEIESTQRIGIRYVNLIRPTDEFAAHEFLNPELRGIYKDAIEGVSNLQNTIISQGKTTFGNLVIRAIQNSSGNFLPDDLRLRKLNFKIKLNEGEVVTLLDIDHYGQIQQSFDEALLNPVLDEMHDFIDNAFRFSVTKEAIAQWS
jgi:uncharacterized protein (TIGR04255 family)